MAMGYSGNEAYTGQVVMSRGNNLPPTRTYKPFVDYFKQTDNAARKVNQ